MISVKLDHLAVSGETRDDARAHIEEALGISMQTGGEHARFATHNHLIGMEDGLYLEAISVDPNVPNPDRPRWFDLDNFAGAPRLTNWVCSVDDIAQACVHWKDAGEPVSLERGDLRWQMAVAATGKLPFDGVFPPLIEWGGTLHPAAMLTAAPISLKMLTVCHPEAEALAQMLGDVIGAAVRFENGEVPELIAEFSTPNGIKTLL
ncbi:VOC family protein [Planktotalea sp.]|uniref:VOC family protein n=1 Tax=Planktotalea sp. TaxID=2029877 RepID=UPI0032967D7D